MAAAQKKEKEPMDMVAQNKIMVETIMKEHRTQKLYLDYSVNPFKKCKCTVLLGRSLSATRL